MIRTLLIGLAVTLAAACALPERAQGDAAVPMTIDCSLCPTTTRWLCESGAEAPVLMIGTLRDVRQIDSSCLADPDVDPNACEIEWSVRITEVANATPIRGAIAPTPEGVIYAHVREQRGLEPVVRVPAGERVLLVGRAMSTYRLLPGEIGHTMSVDFVCPAEALRPQ